MNDKEDGRYPRYKDPPEPPPECKATQTPEPRTPPYSTPVFTDAEQLVIISAKIDTLLEQQAIMMARINVIDGKLDVILRNVHVSRIATKQSPDSPTVIAT